MTTTVRQMLAGKPGAYSVNPDDTIFDALRDRCDSSSIGRVFLVTSQSTSQRRVAQSLAWSTTAAALWQSRCGSSMLLWPRADVSACMVDQAPQRKVTQYTLVRAQHSGLVQPIDGQVVAGRTCRGARSCIPPQRLGVAGRTDEHLAVGNRRRVETREQTEAVGCI
jgi:hypothetical protein